MSGIGEASADYRATSGNQGRDGRDGRDFGRDFGRDQTHGRIEREVVPVVLVGHPTVPFGSFVACALGCSTYAHTVHEYDVRRTDRRRPGPPTRPIASRARGERAGAAVRRPATPSGVSR
jgi:hypothetical protein